MTSDDKDGARGKFFDLHQRATIEAAMARIIPTDDQPGAKEAGTVDFVDRYLSGTNHLRQARRQRLQGSKADERKLGNSA